MNEELQVSKRAAEVRAMFGTIAPRYDLTNTVLSMGIHHLWKHRVARAIPEGTDTVVVDLCTGTGDLLPLLQRRAGTVLGVDFCRPMLSAGSAGSDRVKSSPQILQADALRLPFRAGVLDGLTVAFGVRNLERLEDGLVEMLRVLKPGGRLVILEFGQPGFAPWRAAFGLYSKFLMPLIGGVLTGNLQAYTYLPKTSAAFPCGGLFCDILERAGFKSVDSKPLSGGIAYLYTAIA